MTNMLHDSAPEAVAVDMDFFSSGIVDSTPRAGTEALPCSLQFCQTCTGWQMQELEHHKEACKLHYFSIICSNSCVLGSGPSWVHIARSNIGF